MKTRGSTVDLETDRRSRRAQGGRQPEFFPSLQGWTLRDRLPSEIADFVLALLRLDEPVPDERWQEVREAISADKLGAESRGEKRVTDGKLNDLVRRLDGSASVGTAVEEVPNRPVDWSLGRPVDWSLGGTTLEVDLANYRAVFSDLGTRIKLMTKPDPETLPFRERRLDPLDDRAVLGVTVLAFEEQVGVQLRATTTETLGERLRRLMAEQADLHIRWPHRSDRDARRGCVNSAPRRGSRSWFRCRATRRTRSRRWSPGTRGQYSRRGQQPGRRAAST